MNRASEIFDYLVSHPDADMIILAPMAPPVVRRGDDLTVASSYVLDPGDITDTLIALRSRSRQPETAEICQSGFFFLRDQGGRTFPGDIYLAAGV